MYTFTSSQTVTGDIDQLWSVWTDVDRFTEWDPREERAHLNGPFAVGSTIDSKQKGNPGGTGRIVAVEAGRRWTAESPLPGGTLTIDHTLSSAGHGQVTVSKRYGVTGPLTLLFRLWYGPRVLKALPATYDALAAEAARRAAARG